MFDRITRAIFLIVMAISMSGCIHLLGGEQRVGDQEAVRVAESMGIVEAPKLTAYVRAIGERLVAHSKRKGQKFQFQIVDMAEPNAFALPGGYVYVSRGLLTLVNSEDELAGVIGHEIGHIVARHTARRINVAGPLAVVTGMTSWATGIVSPALGNAVGGAGHYASQFVVAPYSRSQEHDADRIGQELAAKAGWDPLDLSHFLHTLGREATLLAGEERRPSFLDSHPSTPDRVAQTRERAAELEIAPESRIAATKAALFERLDGVVVGDDPAGGIFEETHFIQPELGFALTFPKGWKVMNNRSEVVGVDSSQTSAAMLILRGVGSDPRSFAEQDAEAMKQRDLELESVTINGLPAVHARFDVRTGQGPAFADLTWIAHRDRVYRLMGFATKENETQVGPKLDEFPKSFREVKVSELERITESRLRSRAAQARETLPAIVARMKSTWSAEKAAVANALDEDVLLGAGQLVKVALPQRYVVRTP